MFEFFEDLNIKLHTAIGIVFFISVVFVYYANYQSINKNKPENKVLLLLLSYIFGLLSSLIVIGYYIAAKLNALSL